MREGTYEYNLPLRVPDGAGGVEPALSFSYSSQGANGAMGLRMTEDMTFDCTAAVHDFGWKPRRFSPDFDKAHKSNP